MARRSKDNNQFSLFDIEPVKKSKFKRTVTQSEFIPVARELAMVVIHYKNGIDVSHAFVPFSRVDGHIKFTKQSPNSYNKTFKVLSDDDYWERFHNNQFTLGR